MTPNKNLKVMINQNWVFGRGAGLDFRTGPPTPTSGYAIDTFEGCACISDKFGNLIMYSDGSTVWDSTHTAKITGLLGDSSSTQSCIIIPNPGNKLEYYILTMDGSSNASPPYNHFNGTLVNINTWSNSPLIGLPSTSGYSPAEKLTAIQHSNCKDFWVLTVLQVGLDATTSPRGVMNALGTLRILKVSSTGINFHSDTPLEFPVHEIGYLKSSPDSSKIALANGINNNVQIIPFNSSLGVINLSGLQTITAPGSIGANRIGPYGVEFSPDSQLLYFTKLQRAATATANIFQVDLNNPNLPVVSVGKFRNNRKRYAVGALQLGPDGIIYIALDDEEKLGAILNPNIIGVNCNVTPNHIKLLKGTRAFLGLPNLIPNPCLDIDCNCGCTGCNDNAEDQNDELIKRARTKFNTVKESSSNPNPFVENCELLAVIKNADLKPCFSFHWGDGNNDQIEEHDTEIFYLTICNTFNDVKFNGVRITKVSLIPDIHPIDKIHIVPDRFINLDCLLPCSCQTREFAMINRANDTSGSYSLEVEYCFDNVTIENTKNMGIASFPIEITED